jgi:heat shock protein HslJ
MMPDTHRILLLLAGAVALAACAARDPVADAPPPPRPLRLDDLVGSEWIAEAIADAAVVPGSHSTLRFVSIAQVDGDTACNRFAGPVTVDGGMLRIGPLATTRRACAPALMDQERRYLVAIAQGVALRRDDDRLILLDDRQHPLIRFTQVEPHVPARP